MNVGLVGIGRMGEVLAKKLAGHVDLWLFDRDSARTKALANELDVSVAASLSDIAKLGTVILAVPDREVISCIKEFNQINQPLTVINVATNVAQRVLNEAAASHIKCIGVKLVAHAGEMALGLEPVIIVNERPPELVEAAAEIFKPVGKVVIGRADIVSSINITAAQAALTAAVQIEENLQLQGITDEVIIKSAIRQVAAGILKAYANNDLGPFARDVVQALKTKLRN
ncbi:NAD(P)-binding domain-containing protein [Dendrosporobacter sp. 1207_IL3150]|uniref:NAD(P)-binding domain-containing protein n=1 Tax=Dendrosporobacter sp. 1207_IL3150 TaxID=3084054 RepID=UPI002FD8AC06